ncbi:glycosyltransferase [Patescibacteria group bacterium]|nr:glycosyltransferase [Patescibacteria group bacterium]
MLVTSKPDTKRFPHKKTIVVQGGVDLSPLKNYQPIPVNQRHYDACFIGRLHPQKGVLQLVDIWSLVVSQKPNSRLAIIGNGDLKNDLSRKIKNMKLQKNITTLGFLEGQKKYEIFQNSKMVLHPAIFDSGGMAAAEAMAWGLPAISFNLPALKTYYPQGMIKTPCFDHAQFAKNICRLLNDKKLYQATSLKASKLIIDKWNWNKKASEIFNTIFLNQ